MVHLFDQFCYDDDVDDDVFDDDGDDDNGVDDDDDVDDNDVVDDVVDEKRNLDSSHSEAINAVHGDLKRTKLLLVSQTCHKGRILLKQGLDYL